MSNVKGIPGGGKGRNRDRGGKTLSLPDAARKASCYIRYTDCETGQTEAMAVYLPDGITHKDLGLRCIDPVTMKRGA
jgi:hypothetical protein